MFGRSEAAFGRDQVRGKDEAADAGVLRARGAVTGRGEVLVCAQDNHFLDTATGGRDDRLR